MQIAATGRMPTTVKRGVRALESRMPGKRACPVWRRGRRKRAGQPVPRRRPTLLGEGPTEKERATATSPAAYSTWLNRPCAALDDVRVVTRIRGAGTAAAERSATALVGTTARCGRRGQSDAGGSGAIPV